MMEYSLFFFFFFLMKYFIRKENPHEMEGIKLYLLGGPIK